MDTRSSLRRAIYKAEKLLQAARFASLRVPAAGWPVLLGISIPKSGTHLLDQILLGFSRVAPFALRLHSFYAEYEGETGRRRGAEEAKRWLDSLGPRDVASAHLFARPDAAARISAGGFVPYFIFRDPRDVVVSHAFYVADMEAHHVHHDYYASLPDLEARLRVSILGRTELDIEFPNIAQRFAPYLGWFEHPHVMKLHFEDFVNDRLRTLEAVLDHFIARVPLDVGRARILAALDAAINPKRSPTFRSGRTGEWRRYFTAEHTALFKSVAGDLLDRLGYESGDKW